MNSEGLPQSGNQRLFELPDSFRSRRQTFLSPVHPASKDRSRWENMRERRSQYNLQLLSKNLVRPRSGRGEKSQTNHRNPIIIHFQ